MIFLAKEMTFSAAMLLSIVLIAAQLAITRRHGWKGLAWATGIAIVVILAATGIISAGLPLPREVDEFGIYGELFRLSFILGGFFIALIVALLLAFTVKTD